MAQRHVTLDLRGIAAFQQAWKSSLQAGAIWVPASAIDGELAPEFRAEIKLPFGGEVGPLRCQTIQRMPDGSVAGQIPELRERDRERMKAVLDSVEEVKAWLLETGQLVEPGAAPPAPVEPAPQQEEVEPEEEAPAAAESEGSPSDAPVEASVSSPAPDSEEIPPEDSPAPEGEPADPEGPEALPPEDRSHPEGYLLPEAWSQGEPAMAGELGAKELRDALLDVAMGQGTGVLHIQAAGVERHALLVRGRVMGWRRAPLEASETLGGLLLKSGRLDAGALEGALKVQAEEEKRLGRILIDGGLLPAAQLPVLLQRQVEFVLQLALRQREGQWAFHPCEVTETFLHPGVDVLDMLYRALNSHARSLSPERILGAVRGRLNMRTQVKPTAQALVEGVSWGAQEQALLAAINRDKPLMRNLFNAVDAPREHVAASLWALGELGILSFGQEKRSPAEQARFLRQLEGPIRDRLARLEGANPFDSLELSWICSQEDVEQALVRWQARFDPQRFTQLPIPLREDLDRIQEAHRRAYDQIRTQSRRAELRLELFDAETVQEAAELLVEKAQAMQGAGERKAAYAKALDLVPGIPGAQA